MRSLEECQAEIFRRSEKRIRKRKRITVCVAASLPIFLCAGLLIWGQRPEKPVQIAENVQIAATEPTVTPVTEPLIQQEQPITLCAVRVNDRLLENTDRDAQWEYVNNLFSKEPLHIFTDETELRADDQLKSSGVSADRGYTICFVFSDGASVTYHLEEGILTRDGTEEWTVISAKDLKILYEMFEISEESGGK